MFLSPLLFLVAWKGLFLVLEISFPLVVCEGFEMVIWGIPSVSPGPWAKGLTC